MNNTIKQEQKHIRDLNNRDDDNSNTIDDFYQQSMSIVSSHLKDFYDQYASETGLSLNEVSNQSNHWDRNQFIDAINVLLTNVKPDNELSKRLQVAYMQSNLDKRSLMGAMIGAGIDVATFKSQNYGNNELVKQYQNEYNYRSKKNTKNVPKQAKDNDEFNQNLWTYSDVAKSRANETLNKGLKQGMNKNDMQRLTKVNSTNDKRQSNNISSSANNIISRIQLSFKSQSIDNTIDGQQDAYKENDTNNNYVKWITERDSKVCDICEGYDGEIYDQSDAPTPQYDSHPNCRCMVVECDSQGNLSSVYP